METKQVIVVRKDLNMRKGKLVAQASHASMGVILKLISEGSLVWKDRWQMDHYMHGSPIVHWLENSFTKVCVYVNSEKELLDIYNKCKEDNLVPCYLIKDNGKTEFKNIPTNTCCAIGPARVEDVNTYTKDLKLL